MKIKLGKKGFTLVELMTVIAVMGVLVSVAVPVYSNVTRKAKIQTVATNCRILEGAIDTMKIIANSTEEFSTGDELTPDFTIIDADDSTKKYVIKDFLTKFPEDADYFIVINGKVYAENIDGLESNVSVDKDGEF